MDVDTRNIVISVVTSLLTTVAIATAITVWIGSTDKWGLRPRPRVRGAHPDPRPAPHVGVDKATMTDPMSVDMILAYTIDHIRSICEAVGLSQRVSKIELAQRLHDRLHLRHVLSESDVSHV